ncbi:hypothetical protein JJB99_00570 [Bradyrhizobium diazoefficiens]|uniref:hypothetical protein n=1 Tax=Bradyrhizobium diazoefficiens TaxID=1355477 RepID=UPI00190C9B04|nr:hypothetical protein [Bradyrhizobium diazoefficiens]QQO14732.1 hypothetical protein JJB99_00570 [Bradyrhizobium diazoefficiens]
MPAAPQPFAPAQGARKAVKALLVAVDFLEAKVGELKGAVSNGYARGRYVAPRDRKE